MNLISKVRIYAIFITNCIVCYFIVALAVICKENGFIYQEGDVWNPYFPKFGVVECFDCTCKVIAP